MPRHTRKKTLRIRFKEDYGDSTKIRSSLISGLSTSKIKSRNPKQKRVLKISKVSDAELKKVGEFNPLPEMLMKEFKQIEQANTTKVTLRENETFPHATDRTRSYAQIQQIEPA